METPKLFIRGEKGNLGQDLVRAIEGRPIEQVENPQDSDFVALCVPSHIAEQALMSNMYGNRTIIDFSGASKRNNWGQYGLMIDYGMPWDPQFDAKARLYGNPGCIASAVLMGMRTARVEARPASHLSIFSVGGKSHAGQIEDDEIALSRRLNNHPHVQEIETAFRGLLSVGSFMPTITGGIDNGLLVGVSGQCLSDDRQEEKRLTTADVVGSGRLDYRLEIKDRNFSLGVVIDNLRFVTNNAVRLIHHLHEQG